MINNCGVYKIINKINNKVYVGSSVNLTRRKYIHFYSMERMRHKNKYLQSAYNKVKNNFNFNIDNYFDFIIIEYIEDIEVLLLREQYHLNNYIIKESNTIDRKRCYNISPTAGNTLGYRHTNETKTKIGEFSSKRKMSNFSRRQLSEAKKGKVFSIEHKINMGKAIRGRKLSQEHKLKISKNSAKSKPVINLDTGREFLSIREAALAYNIKNNCISDVCKGKKETSGGFRWKYLPKTPFKKKGRPPMWGRHHSEETKKILSEKSRLYRHTGEAKEKMRLAKLNKKQPPEMVNKRKKKVINLTTGEIFDSLKDAAKEYDIKNPSNIGEVCKGKRKSSGGYEWNYLMEGI